MSIWPPPIATLTNSGSGYSATNISISPAAGSIRLNSGTGQFETFNGTSWITLSMILDADTIKDYIQKAIDNVKSHIETRAPDNVTIQDALNEWVEACERFKVIATLAEHSK